MLNKSEIFKANAVLAIVEDLLSWDPSKEITFLFMYSNSREHGYTIINYVKNKKVSFSESKNSNNIVIYPGKNNGDGSLSEEQFKNKVYFKPNEYKKAAEYIIKFLFKNEIIKNNS